MERDDLTLCPGGWCPLRYTCERYVKWMACDEDDADLEMDPAYDDGKCDSYIQSNTMDNRERQEQIVRSAAKLTQAEREAIAERILEETPIQAVDKRYAKLLGIAEKVMDHTMLRTRDWVNVAIRRMVAFRMKEEGIRLTDIARAMGMNHSTILHYVHQMKDMFDEPIFYAGDIRQYARFKDAVEEADRHVE